MKKAHAVAALAALAQDSRLDAYRPLVQAGPAVAKSDYVKWTLDDPRVDFAISTRGQQPSLDQLGIQVEDKGELNEIYARLHKGAARSSTRDTRGVATRNQRNHASTILQASPGKRS